MGLDVVEFVTALEAQFQITIPDEQARTILTLGEAHRYVVTHYGVPANDPAAAWARIVDLASEHSGLERSALTPSTRILELFPDG